MKRKAYISTVRCTQCKASFPLPRQTSHPKSPGHVKTLWCFKCKEETQHEEIGKY